MAGIASGASTQSGRKPIELGVARRASLGEIVAERMREAILDNTLLPGQHLLEEELSAQLQVSRGPIRDAYAILEREGLVQTSRNRGATVATLSASDLGEVYSLRLVIEILAARFAARRYQDDDLERLQAAFGDIQRAMKKKPKAQEAARLDIAFHDAVYVAAHHQRLYASWQGIRMQAYWFLCRRNDANLDWVGSQIATHREILDLIIARDEHAVEDAVRTHITTAYARLSAAIVQDSVTPVDPADYLLD